MVKEIPVWRREYKRMLPLVERAFMYRVRVGRRGRDYAILGFILWFTRSRAPYMRTTARMVERDATGRAREILSGREESLFARVYRFVRSAHKSGYYDESEAEELERIALRMLSENPDDIDAAVSLSLIAQLKPVRVPRSLLGDVVSRLDRESGKRMRGSKLFGLEDLAHGDEMDDYLIFVVNKPVFEVVEDAEEEAGGGSEGDFQEEEDGEGGGGGED